MPKSKPSSALVAAKSPPELLARGHFNKHVATIYVRPTLSSFERKLWNLLTRNAYPNLASKEEFHLPLEVLKKAAGIKTRDTKLINDALKKIQLTPIEWIKIKEDGEVETDGDWVQFTFLSSVGMVDGEIHYTYSPPLRSQLRDPEVYARINLEAQKNLPKGRALTLYEITSRYRPNPQRGFEGLTPKWPLEYFRELMGAMGDSFNNFKYLNRNVVAPNVKKINEGADIRLTALTFKTGRKVSHIQFEVRDNKQLMLEIPEAAEDSPVYQSLLKYKIVPLDAELMVKEYGEEYLSRKIDLLEKKMREGKVGSPSGFLVSAIRDDYDDSDPEAEKKALEVEKKEAIKAKAEEKRKKEEAKIKEREAEARDLENRAMTILNALGKTDQKSLLRRFEKEVVEDHFIGKAYKKGGVDHLMVRGFWHDFIVQNG